MAARLFTAIGLSLLIFATLTFPVAPVQAASPSKPATLSVNPGEKKSTRVVVNPKAKGDEIAYYEFSVDASRAASPTDSFDDSRKPTSVSSIYYANCYGEVTAYGGFGQRLWIWKAWEYWKYDYSAVVQYNEDYDYEIHYLGWGYDHRTYSGIYASGANHYISFSEGYFTHITGNRKGYVQFFLLNNGACSASGSITSW